MKLQVLYLLGALALSVGAAYATASALDLNRQYVQVEQKANTMLSLKAKLHKTIAKEWQSYTVTEHWTLEHIDAASSTAGNARASKTSTPTISMLKPQFTTTTYLRDPSFTSYSDKGVIYSLPFPLPVNATKLTVKDALGWITTFARHEGVLRVQPRYPLANGWRSEVIIKYVVRDVKDALDARMPFEGMNVEAEVVNKGDMTNYRSLLLVPVILLASYVVMKGMGKETPFDQDRNKLLLAVREVSDLRVLKECKRANDAGLQDLYDKQVSMIEALLQCEDPEQAKQLETELLELDERILDIEYEY